VVRLLSRRLGWSRGQKKGEKTQQKEKC
jgi:hypothetical protein